MQKGLVILIVGITITTILNVGIVTDICASRRREFI